MSKAISKAAVRRWRALKDGPVPDLMKFGAPAVLMVKRGDRIEVRIQAEITVIQHRLAYPAEPHGLTILEAHHFVGSLGYLSPGAGSDHVVVRRSTKASYPDPEDIPWWLWNGADPERDHIFPSSLDAYMWLRLITEQQIAAYDASGILQREIS